MRKIIIMAKNEAKATDFAVIFNEHPLITGAVHTKDAMKEEIFDIIHSKPVLIDGPDTTRACAYPADDDEHPSKVLR